MLRSLHRLLLIGAVVAVAAPACAQQTFGVVDLNYILTNCDRGKEIQQQLREEFATDMDELRVKEQEVTGLRDRLTKEALTLSEDERIKLRHQVEDTQLELERMTQDVEIDVKKRQAELFNVLEKNMLDVIDGLRKEKGLSAVFSKQASGILSIDPSLDLTTEALHRLNSIQ